jgi:hypothetical protein
MGKAAPSAIALLREASKRYPGRRTSSDGIIPSAAHRRQSPNSDHNVGRAGYHHAVDLSHDPPCDCGKIAEWIRRNRDPRVKYVIYNRKIFASYSRPGRQA